MVFGLKLFQGHTILPTVLRIHPFDFHIPEEVWSSNSVDYYVLRIFGCSVYAYVNNGKKAPRSLNAGFFSYAFESKGYKLW